jgi:hypothetical protein
MTAIRIIQASGLFLSIFFLAGAFARLQAGDLKGVLGLLLCATIVGALPFAGRLFTRSTRGVVSSSRTTHAVKGVLMHVSVWMVRFAKKATTWLARAIFRVSARGASYGVRKFSASPLFFSGVLLLVVGTLLAFVGWYHTAGVGVLASAMLFISHYDKWKEVREYLGKHWMWVWLSISVLTSLLALLHEWKMIVFWIGVVSSITSVITIKKWWGKIGWKNGAVAIGVIFVALISSVTLKTKAMQDMVGIIYPLVFLGMMYLIINYVWNKK